MKDLDTGGQYPYVSVDGQSTVKEANGDHNAGQGSSSGKNKQKYRQNNSFIQAVHLSNCQLYSPYTGLELINLETR